MRASERFALTVAAFGLVLLLISFNLNDPFRFGTPIRSDGDGYHIWVIALKTLDFSMCKFADFLSTSQSIAVENTANGVCGVKYPMGVGLFQFPFTFWWASADLSEGYSRNEHFAVSWLGAAMVYLTAAAGFVTLRLIQVQVFTALIAVTAVLFGAGVYHYGTFDASFSHIYTAFGISIAILLSVWRSHLGWRFQHLVLLFFLLLWLYTIRQTNGLAIVVICSYAAWKSQANDRWKIGFSFGAAIALGIGLQVKLNHYVTGHWTLSSYGSEGFNTWPPAIWDVIASSGAGLFIYYPIYLAVLVVGASQRLSSETISLFVVTIGYVLVYSVWHVPLLGAGFGHRGFVDAAPFVTLALGSGLRSVTRKAFAAVTLALGVCVFISLQIMTSYWHRTYPIAGASYELFVSHVLRMPFSLYGGKFEPYSPDALRAIQLKFVGFQNKNGETIAAIRVTNSGTKVITGRADSYARLAVSWRFVNGETSQETSGWDERIPFPSELQPSASATLDIPLKNISDFANALEVSFVQEGVFWGHDIGVSPLSVPLKPVQ